MRKKVVLFSARDPAGKNIAHLLQGMQTRLEVIEVPDSVLYLQNLDIKPDVCVVASKHRSESGLPVLTAHAPGNFGDAAYGGKAGELGIAPAVYLHEALSLLKVGKERMELDYEVCLEATHHGPTSFGFPIMFMEVGSSEIQWNDPIACDAVANAIGELLAAEPTDVPAAIGFGGGHYCRKFSEVEEYAIGHICPKHSLDRVDKEMIEQMIERTTPRPEAALVEKKGMGEEKQQILRLLEATNLDIVKI
jgi:D-aminoacyl-tRNA deacylase